MSMDIQFDQVKQSVNQNFSVGDPPAKEKLTAKLFNLFENSFAGNSTPVTLVDDIQGVFAKEGLNIDEKTAIKILDGLNPAPVVSKPVPTSVTSNVLKPGSDNKEAVGQLQDLLRSKGYKLDDSGGLYRGIYGDQTKKVVTRFQKMSGLTPDGIVGPKTLKALQEYQYHAPVLPDGLSLKDSTIDISHLHQKVQNTFPTIIQVWKDNSAPSPVITSGNDSQHTSSNSKHYSDRAIDIRGNNVSDETLKKMADDLKVQLGAGYFIQAEFFDNSAKDHIHIQYNGN